MTCEDKLTFDSKQWSNYSADIIDLLNKMLIKKPEDRITLEQLLRHQWFNKLSSKFVANQMH